MTQCAYALSLVSRGEIIARVQLAVRVAVPDTKHALVLVWVIIHVHHDGGLGLGDLPPRDELAPAREEVDLLRVRGWGEG